MFIGASHNCGNMSAIRDGHKLHEPARARNRRPNSSRAITRPITRHPDIARSRAGRDRFNHRRHHHQGRGPYHNAREGLRRQTNGKAHVKPAWADKLTAPISAAVSSNFVFIRFNCLIFSLFACGLYRMAFIDLYGAGRVILQGKYGLKGHRRIALSVSPMNRTTFLEAILPIGPPALGEGELSADGLRYLMDKPVGDLERTDWSASYEARKRSNAVPSPLPSVLRSF